jgi:hypothetical protein
MNELYEFIAFIENTLNRPFGVLLIVSGLFFFLIIILLRLNTIENKIAETVVISLGTLFIVTGAAIHTEIMTLLKPLLKAEIPASVFQSIKGSEVRGRGSEESSDLSPLTPHPDGKSEVRDTESEGSSDLSPVIPHPDSRSEVKDTGSEAPPALSPLTPHLCYIPTNQFEFVWNDKGNKSLQHATVYKPLVPAGYKIFGYYIQGDYNAPQGKAYAVKVSPDFEKEGLLAYPSGYDCIWYDVGGNTGGAIWRPVPPPGYRCLGDIVTPGRTEPDRKEIVCVREYAVTAGKLGTPVWDNKGSGSTREISVCSVDPDNPDKGFSLNLFQGYERNMSRSTAFSALPVLRKDCISPEVKSEK